MVVVMMTAAMLAAVMVMVVMVMSAAMVTAMVLMVSMMMVAGGIGIKFQIACQQSLHCFVRISADTAVNGDIRFAQSNSCTAANTAADQRIDSQVFQQTCQCAVTAAVGIYHLGRYNLSVSNVINFKAGCVAKVLEHISIFIGNCNFHKNISFYHKLNISYLELAD